MSWATSSFWLKGALLSILLGTILFVLGFATNEWMVSSSRFGEFSWGLWKARSCHFQGRCGSSKITSYMLDQHDMEVWFRAVQIFECIGLICVAICFIVSMIVVFLQSVRQRGSHLCIIICAFVGVAAIIIGVVIFNSQLDYYDVGWSMGVAIAGAICLFIAGILGVLDLNR